MGWLSDLVRRLFGGRKSRPPFPPPIEPGTDGNLSDRQPGKGGLDLSLGDASIRPRFSPGAMQSFLPDLGPFYFPAPYNSQAVRLTNTTTGIVSPIGMSYHPNINNHSGRDSILVFLSINEVLHLFEIDKQRLSIQNSRQLPFNHTGEYCYWSFSEHNIIYIPQGNKLIRYNVENGEENIVFEARGAIDHVHSSFDGRVHSISSDGMILVHRNNNFTPYLPKGEFDEAQIDKSGRWLLIKETFYRDGQGHLDNRIIDLDSGIERIVRDEDGAVGHSDTGWECVIGEDDQNNPGGVFRKWDFRRSEILDSGAIYYSDWTGMSRYCSYCHARPGGPNFVIISSAHDSDALRANEIIKANFDGTFTVICQNLTDLTAPGGGIEYWKKPRVNSCPVGEWAIWTANHGSDRLDAFLVRIP